MSGEPAPRHVIRSRVEMKPYGAVSATSNTLSVAATCLCRPTLVHVYTHRH